MVYVSMCDTLSMCVICSVHSDIRYCHPCRADTAGSYIKLDLSNSKGFAQPWNLDADVRKGFARPEEQRPKSSIPFCSFCRMSPGFLWRTHPFPWCAIVLGQIFTDKDLPIVRFVTLVWDVNSSFQFCRMASIPRNKCSNHHEGPPVLIETDDLDSKHDVGPPCRHLGLTNSHPGCDEDGVPSAVDFADA
ncbi:hypothetical protein E5288_WYG012155 [Bos mutus]|uniref:Uncharacterized protein n=1 Tax=Bos mutus TaxID=72004 RepID=A0A6B0R1R8_9CETA|nr:hypothetical protein [Bos mutus]